MLNLVLALDAGTTATKAAVLDDRLQVVAVAEEATCVRSPEPGHREIDMDELGESMFRVLEAVLEQVDRSCIRGVAVTGQGDGAWLLDGQMRPVGPAILWNDARSADVFLEMREAGEIDAIKNSSRGSVHPGSLPVIARYLAQHEPSRLARVRHVVNCKDWIRFILTDRLETEASDASRSFLETSTGRWNDTLFEELGDIARSAAVPLADAGDVRALSASAGARLGLAEGLPVTVGSMDVASVGYAFSGDHTERAWVIIGTTTFIGVVRETINDKGHWMAYGTPGRLLNSMAPMFGAPLLEWTRRILGCESMSWSEFEQLASSSEAAVTNRPITMPFFAPSGERAPFVDPLARGSIHGLSYDTTPADIAWSVYAGIAASIAECMDLLDIEGPVSMAGGGSSSGLLCQLVADLSGRTLRRPKLSAEAGMIGSVRRLHRALGIASSEFGSAADDEFFTPTLDENGRQILLENIQRVRAVERSTWSLLAAR